jgi:hypothetical protein
MIRQHRLCKQCSLTGFNMMFCRTPTPATGAVAPCQLAGAGQMLATRVDVGCNEGTNIVTGHCEQQKSADITYHALRPAI